VNSIIYGISPLWITFDHDSAESSIMIAYSDIQDGEESIATNNNGEVHWEDGNIDADPLFIDREDGDYNLSENSPCVDAGTAFFVWEDDTLLNLSPDDYLGNAPDMGAFESEFVNVPSSELPQPTQFMLYPSYPNPFNAVTSIRYDLPKTLQVEINVYDVSGKLVANLVDENQTAGRYNVLWNVGGCSSGLYFIRLDALEFKAVNKVMLVR